MIWLGTLLLLKIIFMNSKEEIVKNWLPRYTGTELEDFGQYIILVNFINYVELFAEWGKVEVKGRNRPMPNATAKNISIINFQMGSPNARNNFRFC